MRLAPACNRNSQSVNYGRPICRWSGHFAEVADQRRDFIESDYIFMHNHAVIDEEAGTWRGQSSHWRAKGTTPALD